MKINKNNYEAFFLDYHEGNLSAEDVAELLLFLEKNPELKEEFENFENIIFEDYSSSTFQNKEELKKQSGDLLNEINASNHNDYFINAVENNLSASEIISLERYLQRHPRYAIEYRLYQRTKLVADATVVFPGKKKLKRKVARIVPFYYYAVAAVAAVLLLFGLFSIFNNNNEIKEMATITTTFQANAINKTVGDNTGKHQEVVGDNTSSGNGGDDNTGNGKPFIASSAKNTSSKNKILKAKQAVTIAKKETAIVPEIINEEIHKPEQQPLAENNVKEIAPSTNERTTNSAAKGGNELADDNSGKGSKKLTAGILSLGEMAVAKIKENTLDETTLRAQKKSGIVKKMSGWDVAQIMAKGVSKLTGRNVALKPKYNDKGDVTAYAFEAGSFEMSKGK